MDTACHNHTTNATCTADARNFCFFDPTKDLVCSTFVTASATRNCTSGTPNTGLGGIDACPVFRQLLVTCAGATTRAACDAKAGVCEFSNGTCSPVPDAPLAMLSIATTMGSKLAAPYVAQTAICAPYTSEASCLGRAAAASGNSSGNATSTTPTTTSAGNGTASSTSSSTARNGASSGRIGGEFVFGVALAALVGTMLMP